MSLSFDYDSNMPLNLSTQDHVSLNDIRFDSPTGNAIEAYVVKPAGDGPFPAILYVHWYEPHSLLTNRAEFLSEGVALAHHGVFSMHISTLWSEPRWYFERELAEDVAAFERQVIDLRRALDVLLAQSGVDAARVAVVGHDFGGMVVALMSRVDQRPAAYVLMASTPRFSEWMLFGAELEDVARQQYIDQISPLDPIRHIGAIEAPVLLQFAKGDFYTPDERIAGFFAAASDPKRLDVVENAGHDLNDEARTKRIQWLQDQLGFTGAVLPPSEQ